MIKPPRIGFWMVVTFAMAVWCRGEPLPAYEPVREFVEALRARGYHDTAVEYLEQVKNSPLVSVEWKQGYRYELGLLLVDGARFQRDMEIREKQLDQGQAALKQFLAEHPHHSKFIAASSALGNLSVERARLRVESSRKSDKRDQELAEARRLFQEALVIYGKLEPEIEGHLEPIPKVLDVTDKQQAALAARRDQLRADLVQAKIMSATVREELADTHAEGSPERGELLNDALKRYNAIYESYRTRIAGLYARQFQGRIAFKLGKIKDAVSYFTELLDQPDSPEAYRTLKTKTLPLLLESWLHDSERKYVEAIRRGQDWLAKARSHEEREPDWLLIRLIVAKAYQAYGRQLEAENPQDVQARNAFNEARSMAQLVAKHPSDYQKEAQQLAVDLGAKEGPVRDQTPKTFDAARAAGQEALAGMQQAQRMLSQLASQRQTEKDASVLENIKTQLEEAQQKSTTSRTAAEDHFRLALELADQDTPLDDLNYLRYFLAYLYYSRDEFLDAAALGEFVARRYPDSSGARPAAKIALASYLRLYADNPTPDKAFESERVISIADFITTKWKGYAEANEALGTLIPFMVNAGEVARAEQYLERIPTDAPQRGEAELKTGQAMWDAYLRGVRELREWESAGATPPDVDLAARREALQDLKTRCQRVLLAGVEHLRQTANGGTSFATAVLSLAQLKIDVGQEDQAIALLEDPQIGPLTLLKKKDPVAQGEGFADETYKTALRAYITSLARSQDLPATVAKAKQVMDAMKATTENTPEGNRKLVAVYISLAQDLQKQLQLATPDTRKALSAGFETFLRQIREEATEFNILNWVADTYQGMAQELNRSEATSAESREYFEQAIQTYESILTRLSLEPQYQSHVRLQLAKTRREVGQFQEAIEVLAGMLQENSALISVQLEAVRTYQQWGELPGNEDRYKLAIQGDRSDPKTKRNLIWGWGRLSQTTAQMPQYADVFYESRYNLARCRFGSALASAKPDDKKRLLEAAEKDITLTAKLYKTLGGPVWSAKYDALAREIQTSNGKAPTGIVPADSRSDK